ncbi:MAG: polyprenol monophosphomannose synthase [Cytophagia bacterium]|nr:MAG: polyprenol monophosphomannose synthase [Cytophagales bacterium]TAG40564.1 MAG: polyprenol monophosphomannose synthase [Cytophagia bacterium]TAG62561.1 MAG: polyprenol monophosphomannose synthase [Runella slithyformis]TAG83608.1 MAG: polyprenol monophosphomannose synthase [Cytophagales bacterium]
MKKSIVIVPTYNEIENIESIIRTVFGLAKPFDVLVVDDGSPDGTAQKVKELQTEYAGHLHILERKGKLGLGTAYIHGFKWALHQGYHYLIEMDADFSHNPTDLMRLHNACDQDGYDVAVGSRYIKGINVVNWPMGRVLMSYFAGVYVRFVTRMEIMDPTAGFVCYKREVLEGINLDQIRFVGYAFQIEMKFNSWKYGYQITEVPIIFTDRTLGVSKMSTKIFNEGFLGVLFLKASSFFKTYIRHNTATPTPENAFQIQAA